ncbi:aspartate--tRNA ligase [Buchnera aphidicola (Nipponaphis monzeni)]|uniref:Aspartate--tRNA ligase n=1 Tax=Buchnera aphidicola (Nipponaphis monzeni) TaxID=2495405 RepID=A0A455TAB3_9GAMM|nr:aspartate--tRNA ligase [Buchnera aphidicola]BBI01259.1 aspartate--tRNA ligase [Buchnera aphidicola (Nipponaphis monzeni)]
MRTMYCGEVLEKHVNKTIFLCGWVQNIRKFGNFIFIDMRDCTGLIQILFDFTYTKKILEAKKLKNEFCIQVIGKVQLRNKKNVNLKLFTGTIELLATSLLIFNSSDPLPLDNYKKNKETVRLKYRYLDLRKPSMLYILKLRSKITHWIHNFMNLNNFINVETPILTKSTPEGARDYIVPSRNYPKKFYALPQSPQIFKQLLMISGFDRYYQIVKCFRDEDLRSDRQPEFTQIDFEMSFMTADQVRNFIELMIIQLWLKIKQIKLKPFPVMNFEDVINLYGTDKPDLRNPIKLIEISDLLSVNICNFIYKNYNVKNSRIAAFVIPKNIKLNKCNIIKYFDLMKKYEICNLFYLKINIKKFNNNNNNNFVQQLWNTGCMQKIICRMNIKDGDFIFIIGHLKKIVNKAFNIFRKQLNIDFNLINKKSWRPLWIINFPLFYKKNNARFYSMHHPFTSPKNINDLENIKNPKKVIADSYDLVINGYEIGGGSVRIHNLNIQQKIFDILGIDKVAQKEKFGFFIEALKFGTPPHAGMALGLDRIVMLLSKTNDIKDVIAFPKTTEATCLTTQAPSYLDINTLNKLFIKTN